MKTVQLIFPHQLFKDSPIIEQQKPIYLVESYLFFSQYPFHKQKIAFHRASMKAYQDYLISLHLEVHYIEAKSEISDIRHLIPHLNHLQIEHINYIDPTDFWLSKRIASACDKVGITYTEFDSPLFLNHKEEISKFFRSDKKIYRLAEFYKRERLKRKILLDNKNKPLGGKWSFDHENRKKYPVKKTPPSIQFPDENKYTIEAKAYVEHNFSDHLGSLSHINLYPINFEESQNWLKQFLEHRFLEFGPYEDAIVDGHAILNHSVLTPMLNVGLINPQEIIDKTLSFASKHDIPINSTEGFVRQIMGWREFMRGMYESRSVDQRTSNFWNFNRSIPKSFYTGDTGIVPIDRTIKKILKSGYCHHIERLMVLGNFMLLCEFDPDEVYQWFMELFIDAYDWVMVPNVYGMSQFADGGLFATKPYISGSNYIMKMSNYEHGDWQAIWDGLFWRFIDVHRSFFATQYRLKMMVTLWDKMDPKKKESHLLIAENFLEDFS